MPRVNVLCLIDTLEKGGGAERLLVDLLPALRQCGIDVTAAPLLRRGDDHSAELERAGVPVHHLDLPSMRAWPQARRKLRSLVRDHGYTTFWGHLYYGNCYAVLARRVAGGGRALATLHSEGYLRTPPTRLRQKLAVALERRVLAAADRCVAVSQSVRHDYATYFGLRDVAVAYNGIDCAALDAAVPDDPASVRAAFGFGADAFLTVTPASLLTKKGHAVLIAAIARLRDQSGVRVDALLCGDGPLKAELEREIAVHRLADQVILSPVVPHERLMPLVASADAVVMPSRREPFGIAAAEAMALGAPAILTDVDGFREITAGVDAALMVPPGDPVALADAIATIRRDPAAAARRAERARAHVRATFDIGACADRWADLLADPAA